MKRSGFGGEVQIMNKIVESSEPKHSKSRKVEKFAIGDLSVGFRLLALGARHSRTQDVKSVCVFAGLQVLIVALRTFRARAGLGC